MIIKKEAEKIIAFFIIELLIFLPFYVADVFAVNPAISNVQASPSFDTATVTWQTDIPSDSKVQYATNTQLELSKSTQETTTSHAVILGPLTPNTLYYYRPSSCAAQDCSSSDISSFSTSASPAPGKINGLENGSVTKTSAEIKWNESSSIYFSHYIIYRSNNPLTNISSRGTTLYTDTGLAPGTTYKYEISAVNIDGIESQKSDALFITTIAPDTTKPIISNLSMISNSLDSVTLRWITDEDANSTVLYGTSAANLNLRQTASGYEKGHSVTLANLQNKTTYYCKAVSCDQDGNCAEQSCLRPFKPTQVTDLSIQLTVPALYNKAIVPVTGTATPSTEVKFFVNDAYKALFTMDRNKDGKVSFDVPGFSSGNNSLKAVVEDSFGNKKESQVYPVMIDMSPPILSVTPLPSQISSRTVRINGSVSERSTIKIYLKLLQSQDYAAPSQVPNFHVDEVKQNSVTVAWTNVNESDFKEYIIYRNDIPIATAVSSPFKDDELVSSGTSYRYEIAAVDLNCNIGPRSVTNAQTESGGIRYNETPQAEQMHCLNRNQTPKYTLPAQYPNFFEDISLEQGLNEIIVEAVDDAGNSDKKQFDVFYDSENPVILNANIDTLSPSYIRDVTVKGTTSEEAYVCVYINSQPDTRPYRPEEVNESANFSGSKYCDNTENKTFSIDIQLERNPDYAYDAERPTTQTSSMFVSTGDAWDNKLTIVATDNVGLRSDPFEGNILYALCGNSGEWGLLVGDVIPTEIIPRYLIEGMAQVGISFDLSWRGSGTPPGITDIDVREGYPMGMSDSLNQKFDTKWISQISDQWSDEYNKGYVLIDLKAQDPTPPGKNWTMYQKEENLSKHNQGQCFNAPFSQKDESYIKGAGCIRIPLTVEINYEKTVRVRDQYVDRKETATQKECVTVDVLIQPRIPPDIIPNSLLEGAVDFLNNTINLIDSVLEPLQKALQATMVICFAMWAMLYVKKVTEGFSCSKNIFGLTGKTPNCKCTIEDSGIKCLKKDGSGEEDDECESCVESKISTKKFEKMMHLVCDRIMCPAVPSYEKYVKDNSKKEAKSNCEAKFTINYDSEKQKNENPELCDNAVKGLVNKDGTPILSKPECCDEEYVREWSSACIFLDPLEESHALAHPTDEQSAFSQIWRSVSNFKLCRPGDNDEKQININGQWFILKKNTNYENLDPKDKEKTFEWDVWVGLNKRVRTLSNGNLVNDTEEITKDESQKLTGTQIRKENCVKYGKEPLYIFGKAKWPKYTKRMTQEETTSYGEMPYESSVGEIRAASNDNFQDTDENFIKKNPTITLTNPNDNIQYQYEKVLGSNNYRIVTGEGYKIENEMVKRTTVSTQKSQAKTEIAPVPDSIVSEVCSGAGADYIVNPTDSIFRSVQCVCLSALYSYLKLYRKILGLIKDCFQTILLTGDGSSGVCQAVLSYYVCDLLYYMFSCFKGYTGFGTTESSGSTTLDFLKGIVGAGAEVQQSVQNRYGDTNMFQVMFVDKKIIHAACMAFFGIDADFDLAAIAEQSMNMPIKSAVSVFPAERRFVGFNPIDGITNHIYHAGLMIVSGSDNMRYNVYLVCSTNNQCDKNYFENGRCDCVHSGQEITKDITNEFGGNGMLNQGETFNKEAFVEVNYNTAEARFRYDKIRVEYDYMDNTGHVKKEKVERELSQIGSAPVASCSFNLLAGMFRCGIFTEETTACILNDPEVYFTPPSTQSGTAPQTPVTDGNIYNAEKGYLSFKFNARKESTTGDRSKTFTATLKVMDGSTERASMDQVIDTEREYVFDKIKISDSWFNNVGSSGSGSCDIKENTMKLIAVDSCDSDARITCEKINSDAQVKFKIEKGNYDNGGFTQNNPPSLTDCTAVNKDKTAADCGSYRIRFSYSNLDCTKSATIDKQQGSTSTSTATSKPITYSITIYRPKSNNSREKSETIAKCGGQLQEKKGSFMIYKGPNPSAPVQTTPAQLNQQRINAGQDGTPPTISNFKINGFNNGRQIGPIRVSDNPQNIIITALVKDPYDLINGIASSGLEKVELQISPDGTVENPVLQFNTATYETNLDNPPTNAVITVSEKGLHKISIKAYDKAGGISNEESIDGVWFGTSCKENGICAPNCNYDGWVVKNNQNPYEGCSEESGGLICCEPKPTPTPLYDYNLV